MTKEALAETNVRHILLMTILKTETTSPNKASLKITDNFPPPQINIFKNLKEGSLRTGIIVLIHSVYN